MTSRTRDLTRHANAAAVCGVLLLSVLRARADYPIASHRYLADPASLVQDGRLYLYASNDDDNDSDDGYEMRSIVAVSTDDLKNWTDHGEVLRVPAGAAWADMSWAPAVIERNGTIFMYFGNNANGIGVVSSTSPTGPFEDPRGSALITSSTPGASGTDMWLFDPGVFIDDDEQAYLYFGGNAENNARVILLNEDMISVDGSAIQLTIPYFYEASWMHERDGVYYLSYSTNPENGLRIDYLTSSSPTGGFTHRGTAGPQPPSNENNNHAAIFEWNAVWYHAYHNRYVAMENGDPPGYKRNLALETLTYAEDGSIDEIVYTTDGLSQLKPVDPYTRVEAETFAAQRGVETAPCSEGGMALTALEAGDWVRVRGVDFGTLGAASFSASVASEGAGGSIELRAGGETGELLGACNVAATGGAQMWSSVSCDVTGATQVTDLYLVFQGSGSSLFNVDYWEFTPAIDSGAGGAGGISGGTGGISGGVAGAAAAAGQTGGGVAGVTGGAGSAGASGSNAGGSGALGGAGSAGSNAGTSSAGMSASGGGGSGGAAGALANAGGTSGAGVTHTPETDGGCGCRTTRGSTRSPWLELFALCALATARRSRRRRD